MSGGAQLRETIGSLFNANWDSGTTPVAWPNRSIDPPQDANWVSMEIFQTDSFQVEIGSSNNQHRTTGLIILVVNTPLNAGDKAALDLADTAANIFRNNKRVSAGSDGDVKFRNPIIRVVGPDQVDVEKSVYFKVNVEIPFEYDFV